MGVSATVFFFAGLGVVTSYGAIAANAGWRQYVLSPERIHRATKAQPDDAPPIAVERKRLKRFVQVQM
jgi:hypothetical protein